MYEVVLELNNGVPSDQFAQVTISQDIYTSNIVTIPIIDPTAPKTVSPGATPAQASPAMKSKRNLPH
jgi:hypothetical protein